MRADARDNLPAAAMCDLQPRANCVPSARVVLLREVHVHVPRCRPLSRFRLLRNGWRLAMEAGRAATDADCTIACTVSVRVRWCRACDSVIPLVQL